MQEKENHGGDNCAVYNQIAHRLAKGSADDSFIVVPAEFKCPVEVTEEPGKPAALAGMVPLCHRLENCGAERRSQNHCHHHRDNHGRDDGNGELAIDYTGGAAKKGHG